MKTEKLDFSLPKVEFQKTEKIVVMMVSEMGHRDPDHPYNKAPHDEPFFICDTVEDAVEWFREFLPTSFEEDGEEVPETEVRYTDNGAQFWYNGKMQFFTWPGIGSFTR